MLLSTKKFNAEIKQLQKIFEGDLLQPLRKEQIKHAVLQHIANSSTLVTLARVSWWQAKKKLVEIAASFAVSIGLLGGTAFASTSAIPGDLLYPVKRAAEKVEVAVTVSEQGKAEVEAKHAERRLEELTEIKARVEVTSGAQPSRAQVKAEAEAEAGVSGAVKTLHKVRAKLEEQSNSKEAAGINEKLLHLEAKARAEHILNFTKDEADEDANSTRGRKKTEQEKSINDKSTPPPPIIVNEQEGGKVKGTSDTPIRRRLFKRNNR